MRPPRPTKELIAAERVTLDNLHRSQAGVAQQIQESARTIETSLALLRRIDEMLAKSALKPPH
jgi:hypothetical protein